jgi:hypothetical protein
VALGQRADRIGSSELCHGRNSGQGERAQKHAHGEEAAPGPGRLGARGGGVIRLPGRATGSFRPRVINVALTRPVPLIGGRRLDFRGLDASVVVETAHRHGRIVARGAAHAYWVPSTPTPGIDRGK